MRLDAHRTDYDPPAPVYELKTSTFTGKLTTGGAAGFPFTVVNPGDISLSITELAPVSTLTMGLALGSWDAAASTCTQQLSTNTATVNAVFAANPSAPGEYCVGIFDIGKCAGQQRFRVEGHVLLMSLHRKTLD